MRLIKYGPVLLASLWLAVPTIAQPRGRIPIVFVHGSRAAGDSFATQIQRFISNGYRPEQLHAFDYNGIGGRTVEGELLDFIRDVLVQTGASQVNLLGHSRGGFECYNFLADPTRRALVARYAHVGSFRAAALPGPAGDLVPTLNLWSDADAAITNKGDIPGATNVQLVGLDHLEIAFSPSAFVELYGYFNDGAGSRTTAILPGSRILLSGKAITFASNQPLAGAEVTIYEVDPASGERLTAGVAFTADERGGWGPFEARRGTYYELRVGGVLSSDQPVHYFREPFARSNSLVYLRLLRPVSFAAGLQLIPRDARSVHGNLTHGQAVIAGRDSLRINGHEVAVPEIAPAEKIMVISAFWDANRNGVSDGTAINGFHDLFIQGVDLHLPSGPIEARFNGRTLRARAIPSSEGLTFTWFE